MTLALVGIAAVLALLAFGKKKEADAAPPPPPPPPGPSTADLVNAAGGGAAALAGVGATAAAVVGGAAFIAAGAGTGYAITNKPSGAVIGGLNPISGNVVNLGIQSGTLLNAQLGGSVQHALPSSTGIVAEVSGGVIAGAAMVFGGLAGVSMALVAAPIYLVWTIVEDAQKLAYGQSGAKATFSQVLTALTNLAMNSQMADIQGAGFDVPRDVIARTVKPYVNGYMLQWNRLNYLRWMASPRGIGQSEYGHAKFGFDRGYFTGGIDAGGGLINPYVSPRSSGIDLREPWYQHVLDRGRIAANMQSYVDWMQTSWGFGLGELGHAAAGQKQGRYEGTLTNAPFEWVDPSGEVVGGGSARLDFLGRQSYWRNKQGNKLGAWVNPVTEPCVAPTLGLSKEDAIAWMSANVLAPPEIFDASWGVIDLTTGYGAL